MPTLQDVARQAGVSTATVSKVLSNTPYFTEDTRGKVMDAVNALGYRPHFAGRALSRGRTHIIAVVFPYLYDKIFRDPLVLAIIEGIEEELTKQNYTLLLSTPRLTDEDNAAFSQLLRSGYMDGIIAIDSVPGSPISETVRTHNIPLVVLGYHNAPYQVHCDDYAGGRLLMNYLLDLGHRHIGLIRTSDTSNIAINERVRGMQDAMQDAGIPANQLIDVEGNFSTGSGAQAARYLCRHAPQITAIACVNDRMAIGAIQQLQQDGVRVPQDMSVIGYDNVGMSEMLTPALTTVSQHASRLGRRCAEMLLDRLKDVAPSTVVIAPTLMIRASSAKPREMDFVPQGQG